MAVVVKVGPWGASGGEPHNIPVGSIPQSLVRITICSSKAIGGPILGISFVYIDQNGEPIDVSPWGMINPEQRTTIIEMGAGEYLYVLSGIASDSNLFWLRLVTNQHVYEVGSPLPAPIFSVPLGNGKVVAFFSRSDDTLKALGMYVAPVQDWPVKIGPWGGSGGETVDISTPVQLKSFTVYSTESSDGRIYGISFTYIDQNGDSIDVGPWGTTKGHKHTFSMSPGEYLNNVSGTFDDDGVTSLKFTTNQAVYGPYGCERGTAFSVPLPDDCDDNGTVSGLFGRCRPYRDDNDRHDNDSSGEAMPSYLNAIGVYVGLAPKP